MSTPSKEVAALIAAARKSISDLEAALTPPKPEVPKALPPTPAEMLVRHFLKFAGRSLKPNEDLIMLTYTDHPVVSSFLFNSLSDDTSERVKKCQEYLVSRINMLLLEMQQQRHDAMVHFLRKTHPRAADFLEKLPCPLPGQQATGGVNLEADKFVVGDDLVTTITGTGMLSEDYWKGRIEQRKRDVFMLRAMGEHYTASKLERDQL